MRYLISIDVTEGNAANAVASLKLQGFNARVARVRNGVANIDFIFGKGAKAATLPTGATLNSARKYKFNDKTFSAKALTAKPCVTWS